MVRPRGVCYHCESKDHFIAQCPRKAATVSAFPEKNEGNNQINKVCFNKSKGYKNPYQPFHKGKQGRVMFVYEDEEGELQFKDIEQDEAKEENPSEEQEESTEGIHLVRTPEDFTESDYVPGSFFRPELGIYSFEEELLNTQ